MFVLVYFSILYHIPVIRKYGPFLRVFMREVTVGHEIKSGIGNSIDLGSFLMS